MSWWSASHRQVSATRYVDVDLETTPSLYKVLSRAKSSDAAIQKTELGFDVLASHVLLAAIEEALEPGDEQRISAMLSLLKPQYDCILIDTPPGKAMLAFNGLPPPTWLSSRRPLNGWRLMASPISSRTCGKSCGRSLP